MGGELKAALIGVGAMGRGHLENLIKLTGEGGRLALKAICDVDQAKLDGAVSKGNMGVGEGEMDLGVYDAYLSIEDMLKCFKPDLAVVALPTFLHSEVSCMLMERGVNVLCEKPMALSTAECAAMAETSERTGARLMIGQCLRFWPQYEVLKRYADEGTFGKVKGAYFFRGGGTPKWSWENWLLREEMSRGCLLDQHIHDVDMINHVFGLPSRVFTSAANAFPGSGYDIVSTNYMYDGLDAVINAQDDWTLNGEYGFEMVFRVNFERGSLIFSRDGSLRILPSEGKALPCPDMPKENGYLRELRYFVDAILEGTEITVAPPRSTMDTIRIAEAELRSAASGAVAEV